MIMKDDSISRIYQAIEESVLTEKPMILNAGMLKDKRNVFCSCLINGNEIVLTCPDCTWSDDGKHTYRALIGARYVKEELAIRHIIVGSIDSDGIISSNTKMIREKNRVYRKEQKND